MGFETHAAHAEPTTQMDVSYKPIVCSPAELGRKRGRPFPRPPGWGGRLHMDGLGMELDCIVQSLVECAPETGKELGLLLVVPSPKLFFCRWTRDVGRGNGAGRLQGCCRLWPQPGTFQGTRPATPDSAVPSGDPEVPFCESRRDRETTGEDGGLGKSII